MDSACLRCPKPLDFGRRRPIRVVHRTPEHLRLFAHRTADGSHAEVRCTRGGQPSELVRSPSEMTAARERSGPPINVARPGPTSRQSPVASRSIQRPRSPARPATGPARRACHGHKCSALRAAGDRSPAAPGPAPMRPRSRRAALGPRSATGGKSPRTALPNTHQPAETLCNDAPTKAKRSKTDACAASGYRADCPKGARSPAAAF